MTNPHVAKAIAKSYLAELYTAAGWPVTPDLVELLVEHTFDNIREGEDGYPVVKQVGKNRLVIEFNLDAKLLKPTPEPTSDDGIVDAHIVDEEPPADPGPESSDGYVLPGEREREPEQLADAGVSGEQAVEGFRSPWMDKGDEAAVKAGQAPS